MGCTIPGRDPVPVAEPPMDSPAVRDRRDLLGLVPIFSKLDPEQLDALLDVTRLRRIEAREEVFHKGDEGTQVFVVLKGRLKVVTHSPEGAEVVFGIIDLGEVFGELALLGGGLRRSATLTAIEPCELLVIDRQAFLPFLHQHPEAAVNLLEVLANRLRDINEFVEDTVFLKVPSRLAKKLLNLSRSYGERCAQGTRINLRLSQRELGELVGASRETVNRQLRTWTEEGAISMEEGYLTIHNASPLESLARFSAL